MTYLLHKATSKTGEVSCHESFWLTKPQDLWIWHRLSVRRRIPVSHFDTWAANIPPFISFSDYFRLEPHVWMFQTVLFLLPDTFSLTHWHTVLADRQISERETWGIQRMNMDGAVHLSICRRASLTLNTDGAQRGGWKEFENESDVNKTLIFFREQPRVTVLVAFIRRDLWNISFGLSVNTRIVTVRLNRWRGSGLYKRQETGSMQRCRRKHIHTYVCWAGAYPRMHWTEHMQENTPDGRLPVRGQNVVMLPFRPVGN